MHLDFVDTDMITKFAHLIFFFQRLESGESSPRVVRMVFCPEWSSPVCCLMVAICKMMMMMVLVVVVVVVVMMLMMVVVVLVS